MGADSTRSAVQDTMPTESYGNFGLNTRVRTPACSGQSPHVTHRHHELLAEMSGLGLVAPWARLSGPVCHVGPVRVCRVVDRVCPRGRLSVPVCHKARYRRMQAIDHDRLRWALSRLCGQGAIRVRSRRTGGEPWASMRSWISRSARPGFAILSSSARSEISV